MSHVPESSDTPGFDPRSEKFLESLRNLVEFKIRRQNFDQNQVEIQKIYSRSMADALDFATNELEGDGWYLESITRIWDERFFDELSNGSTPTGVDDDGFVTLMRQLFGDEQPDAPVQD